MLKPGGDVILRDYGLYDHAMMRFKSGHKIQDHFYKRQDGTRAYYFTTGKFSSRYFNLQSWLCNHNRYLIPEIFATLDILLQGVSD